MTCFGKRVHCRIGEGAGMEGEQPLAWTRALMQPHCEKLLGLDSALKTMATIQEGVSY